jgi:uncharacterized protein YkwD
MKRFVPVGIFILSVYAAYSIGYTLAEKKNTPEVKERIVTVTKTQPIPDTSLITDTDLLAETNRYRTTNGIRPLIVDNQLALSASLKCADMVKNDYWSHTTNDGKEPWVFMDAIKYYYRDAGENLAYGYDNSLQVVKGWYESTKGHKENLLKDVYTRVGFAKCFSPNYVQSGAQIIVVQHFASK